MICSRNNLETIYRNRFNDKEQEKRIILWKTLCSHFFQKYVPLNSSVLDIGAGSCEFINNIDCKDKFALDINSVIVHYANKDVKVIVGDITEIKSIDDESIDISFASNFFEHLPDKDAFLNALLEIYRVLRSGGKLLVLQPNISVLHGKYWDFIDHHIPLTHLSVAEALGITGFRIVEIRSRFLPYTTKSLLPINSFLVRLYLLFRPAHYLLGKQAWIVAEKK